MLQRLGLLQVRGEPRQHRIEHTAGLADVHQVDVELVEDPWKAPEGVGERRAGLDVVRHLGDDVLEALPLHLHAQRLETLDERKTRRDHRGELAAEDGDVLAAHAADQAL